MLLYKIESKAILIQIVSLKLVSIDAISHFVNNFIINKLYFKYDTINRGF